MTDYKKDLDISKLIAERVHNFGGVAYYVGGYVRDKLLKKENKDIDIEIHGIEPQTLENILDSIGKRMNIGESFGIYGLKGYTVDIAMPRKEKQRGKGHRDFDVLVDSFIGTKKAAERRDFTVNALMENVLTGEIVDHFGGIDDLKNKTLKHVNDETFPEDPLRVLRAAQFSARFSFSVHPDTVELCRNTDLSDLSRERIEAELEKALLKADKPSVFFEVLRKMNQLSVWFPELEALIGVEQNPKYHSEGDVWNHTMMVIDKAAAFRDKVTYPLGFMMTAIVHDFGKAVCTKRINGVIHSYNHEIEGLYLVESFLKRITGETKLKKYVINMTKLHMRPNILANSRSSVKATNKMFDESVSPNDLIYFSLSDSLGRIKQEGEGDNSEFLFERLEVFEEIMSRPYVMGKDLIEAGLQPGEYFSETLLYAHKLRLAGVKKEEAFKQVISYAKKLERKKKNEF